MTVRPTACNPIDSAASAQLTPVSWIFLVCRPRLTCGEQTLRAPNLLASCVTGLGSPADAEAWLARAEGDGSCGSVKSNTPATDNPTTEVTEERFSVGVEDQLKTYDFLEETKKIQSGFGPLCLETNENELGAEASTRLDPRVQARPRNRSSSGSVPQITRTSNR